MNLLNCSACGSSTPNVVSGNPVDEDTTVEAPLFEVYLHRMTNAKGKELVVLRSPNSKEITRQTVGARFALLVGGTSTVLVPVSLLTNNNAWSTKKRKKEKHSVYRY